MADKNVQWKKIKRPKFWRPEAGEEIVGYYIGRTVKDGQHGPYGVLTILVPEQGALLVSGTMIIQLADIAMLKYGALVKIRFLGYIPVGRDHEMKKFELYVSETDLTAEDVLNVKHAVDEAQLEDARLFDRLDQQS